MTETPAKSRLLRLLPVVAVLAIGAWLWKNVGPQPREIIWQLGARHGEVREMDIQIRDDSGALVKREQLFFQGGAPAEVVEKVTLSKGTFDGRAFLRRDPGLPEDQVHTQFQISDVDTVVVPADIGGR